MSLKRTDHNVAVTGDIQSRITGPTSGFDELKTVQRTPLIELKSAVDSISLIRNRIVTEVSGSASISNSEYTLTTAPAVSSRVVIDSAERGRYLPGYEAIASIGVRTPTSNPTLTGNMELRWGYYDDNDGYYFGKNANGTFIAIRRAGVDTKTYQSSWNGDKLDGATASNLTLSVEDGNIFQIRYAWYGYGAISFEVITKDLNRSPVQFPTVVHTIDPRLETSIEQPNLPIRCEVINGSSSLPQSLYLAGRQYVISGKYNPNYRLTAEFRGSVNTSTTWVPLVSFRRKTSSKFLAQSVKLSQLEAIATGVNHVIGFVLNGTLTNASWQTPTSQSVDETVVESDISATAISGGTFIGGFHLVQATNKGSSLTHDTGFDFDFVEDQPITMVARTVTGTDSIACSVLSIREDW